MTIFRRFKQNSSGSAAVIFGVASLPLLGVAGAALDYSRAAAAHTDLQRAVDATALALVRDAGRMTDAELQTKGQAVFGAMFRTSNGIAAEPVKVTRGTRTIRVAAAGSVQTTLAGVLGFTQIAIGTDAEVAWGSKKVELALVLDNTGSMDRIARGAHKMDALKRAANDLFDVLSKAAPDDETIKVSVVPFNTQVRLDTAKTGRRPSWLAYSGAVNAGNWQGYVEDRDQPYDVNNRAPNSADPKSLYPAARRAYASDLAEMRPLTEIRKGLSSLRATVDAMRPTGNTNITLGVAWGLASLTNTEPMSGAAASATDIEKVIIVLTDGDNTQNRINGAVNTDPSKIDPRTAAACSTSKDAGITVITIRVVEGNASLLKRCASKPTDPKHAFYRNGEELYHDVQNPADLTPVFQQIANQILATRLTH